DERDWDSLGIRGQHDEIDLPAGEPLEELGVGDMTVEVDDVLEPELAHSRPHPDFRRPGACEPDLEPSAAIDQLAHGLQQNRVTLALREARREQQHGWV